MRECAEEQCACRRVRVCIHLHVCVHTCMCVHVAVQLGGRRWQELSVHPELVPAMGCSPPQPLSPGPHPQPASPCGSGSLAEARPAAGHGSLCRLLSTRLMEETWGERWGCAAGRLRGTAAAGCCEGGSGVQEKLWGSGGSLTQCQGREEWKLMPRCWSLKGSPAAMPGPPRT